MAFKKQKTGANRAENRGYRLAKTKKARTTGKLPASRSAAKRMKRSWGLPMGKPVPERR